MKGATIRLTGLEIDALNGILAVVMNYPDWFFSTNQEHAAAVRVLDKVQDAIREAVQR